MWRRHDLRRAFLGAALPLALVAAVSAVIALAQRYTPAPTLLVLYLPAVIASAVFVGSRASVVAACASFVAFDVLFVEPRFTVTVSDPDEWVSLAALLLVGLVTGQLAGIARHREAAARQSERAAALLYRIARVMNATALDDGLQETADLIRSAIPARAVTIRGDLAGRRIDVASGPPEVVAIARQRVHARTRRILTERDVEAGRPGVSHWIKVRPGMRPAARETFDLYHVRLAATPEDGWLVVALDRGTPELDASTKRLLLAAASEIGEAVERERLRREATAVEVLRRADEIKDVLLNTVSHDLRTPLAAIIAAADSLCSEIDWSDEDRRDFLQSIAEEARRLDRLVRHLLDLSRIEAGALSLQLEWHDVDDVVRLATARLREGWPGRSINARLAAQLPPARLDRIAVEEIIGNLVDNACRHTPPETTITIGAEASNGTLRLIVDDDGPGIPPEELPRLFQPFERARGLRDRRGTGLGLAVAHALAAGHGGSIAVANRPEGGARFTVEFPGALAPALPQAVG